jgi:hypothetical protein
MYQNGRRDMKGEGQRPVNSEFLDLTDRENPNFRVSLPRLRYSMVPTAATTVQTLRNSTIHHY